MDASSSLHKLASHPNFQPSLRMQHVQEALATVAKSNKTLAKAKPVTESKSSLLDILDLPAFPVKVQEMNSDQRKMVALLMALGETREEVARKLLIPASQVESFCHSPEGVELVVRLQTALFPDPTVRVKKAAHSAIDAALKLLYTSKKEEIVAKIAIDLMDRSLGKAVQVNENRNITFDLKDVEAADKALAAQEERLARLEAMQRKLLASHA